MTEVSETTIPPSDGAASGGFFNVVESFVRRLRIRARIFLVAAINIAVIVILAILLWLSSRMLSQTWTELQSVRSSERLVATIESEAGRVQSLIHRYFIQPTPEVLAEIEGRWSSITGNLFERARTDPAARRPSGTSIEGQAGVVTAQIGHGRFDGVGAFAGLQPLDHLGHLRVQRLARFLAHPAHKPGQRPGIFIFQTGHQRRVGQVIQATLLGLEDGHPAHQAMQPRSPAEGTVGLAPFRIAEGAKEDAHPFATIQTGVFVDGHLNGPQDMDSPAVSSAGARPGQPATACQRLTILQNRSAVTSAS